MELGGANDELYGNYDPAAQLQDVGMAELSTEQYDDGDRSAGMPVADGDLLPTAIASEVDEFDAAQLGLSTVHNEQVKIEEGTGRLNQLEERAAEHRQQLAEIDGQIAQQQAENDGSRGRIADALKESRHLLWEEMYVPWDEERDRPGYAVGTNNIANAVRLSPQSDVYESGSMRQARVEAVSAAAEHIIAGQPTLIRVAPENAPVRYVAGIPIYDGFSLHRDRPEPGVPDFMLGLNEQPVVRITDGWWAEQQPEDGTVDVYSSVTVYSGEAVGEYIRAEAVRSLHDARQADRAVEDAIFGLSQNYNATYEARRQARQNVVDVITAARGLGVPAVLPESERGAISTLTDHLFDEADSQPYTPDNDEKLVIIATALRDVYPEDAKASLADHLIKTSLWRFDHTGGEHKISTFARNVTKVVCGVPEDDVRYAARYVRSEAES